MLRIQLARIIHVKYVTILKCNTAIKKSKTNVKYIKKRDNIFMKISFKKDCNMMCYINFLKERSPKSFWFNITNSI